MTAAKAYFLSRLPREKYLVTTLIFAGAAVWLFIFAGKANTFWSGVGGYSRNRATLTKQAATIARSGDVDIRSEAAVATLVPANTLSANRLNAEVGSMARESGLMPQILPDGDTTSGQFSVHTVRMTVARITDWSQITSFYLRLNERQPYMNLQEMQITASGNPPAHSLMVRISSVERTR